MSAPKATDRPLLTGGEQLGESIVLNRGGRPPAAPRSFAEARDHLAPQVDLALRQAAQLPNPLRGRRIVVEATILPNYLANSHHPGALLAATGLVPVGSRGTRGVHVQPSKTDEDAQAKTYLLSGDRNALPELQRLLAQPSALTKGVMDDVIKISTIALPQQADVLRMGTGEVQTLDGRVVLEAVLHPIIGADGEVDEVDHRRVLSKFDKLVKDANGLLRLDRRRNEDHLTFIPLLVPADQISTVAAFNPLRTLRPMPRIAAVPHIEPANPFRSAGQKTVLAPGTRPSTNQRIAIFDGGADAAAPALAPYVRVVDLTDAPEDADAVAHGTTVASAALYGSLKNTQPQTDPPAALDVFRVWPPPVSEQADTNLYWVLERIEEQVRAGAHKIINLSLGPQLNVEDDHEPHAWTLALDRMMSELGVTFIVAAGNTGQDDADAGLNRIGVPADTINGISVGACDTGAEHPTARASYSSVGPGRHGSRVAPTGVIHGGDEKSSDPFGVVVPGGLLMNSWGTSLAAPYAARAIAELADIVGPARVKPHLLRAFATHFAERSVGDEHELGWGRLPSEYAPLIGCEANQATVLYEGRLRRGGSVKLPVPLPLQASQILGNRRMTLRYTLVFTTEVDGTDPVDYGHAGIDVTFRPHAQKFTMSKDGEKAKVVNRSADRQAFAEMVRDGWRPSDRPCSRTRGSYAPETERRDNGKWETATRSDDRLAGVSLRDPAFDLHYLARESGDLTPAQAELWLPYTLLVTMEAPADVGLYEAVRQYSPLLTPLVAPAPVSVTA